MQYRCECGPGHEGRDCERQRDLCASGPCENGASCLIREPGTVECVCAQGYRGTFCEEFIDLCKEEPPPCLHGGRCNPYVGGFDCYCYGSEWISIVRCGWPSHATPHFTTNRSRLYLVNPVLWKHRATTLSARHRTLPEGHWHSLGTGLNGS